MEILFLGYDLSGANSFYRSTGITKDLQKKTGHNITTVTITQVDLDWSFINKFDLVLFQRPFTRVALSICAYIKECGIPLWIDWDDDLFHLNDDNPQFWTYNDPGIIDAMKGIISLADAVSVPTEYLRQVLNGLNKNIFVIPNAFNDSLFTRQILPKRTNNVVWRGTNTHEKDLWLYSKEIDKCMSEHLDWRFIYQGYWPWFLSKYDNSIFRDMEDVLLYHKHLFKTAPAVIQVPIEDNVFNRSKSPIAAIEGTYAGAVCIVPEWWNFPGTLSYHDNKSYYEALRSVLAGEVDLTAQNLMAWEFIQDCLTLSKVNIQRLELIDSLF
jgi:hypothetical protein